MTTNAAGISLHTQVDRLLFRRRRPGLRPPRPRSMILSYLRALCLARHPSHFVVISEFVRCVCSDAPSVGQQTLCGARVQKGGGGTTGLSTAPILTAPPLMILGLADEIDPWLFFEFIYLASSKVIFWNGDDAERRRNCGGGPHCGDSRGGGGEAAAGGNVRYETCRFLRRRRCGISEAG